MLESQRRRGTAIYLISWQSVTSGRKYGGAINFIQQKEEIQEVHAKRKYALDKDIESDGRLSSQSISYSSKPTGKECSILTICDCTKVRNCSRTTKELLLQHHGYFTCESYNKINF